MIEKWHSCVEFNIPSSCYELLSICEDINGLKIIFCDEIRHIKITYSTQYLAYRCCDEADRWKRISEVLFENGNDYFKKNLVSIVENSELKKWFMSETSFCYKDQQVQHHSFVTRNDVIDVLAVGFPLVEVESCFCKHEN
ncbi:MAG: hypothetical protein HDT27_01460 [Subdoligranulum sp.]|nr:hypothetical protein [Subdoligranulum sp.]